MRAAEFTSHNCRPHSRACVFAAKVPTVPRSRASPWALCCHPHSRTENQPTCVEFPGCKNPIEPVIQRAYTPRRSRLRLSHNFRPQTPRGSMADEFNYDVFLSHSVKDKPIVRELAERFHNGMARRSFKSKMNAGLRISSKRRIRCCW